MLNGLLYIVATPIGNLTDITLRAITTLQSVDLILAEDTRHSKKLLAHYKINTKLRSFHEHNESVQTKHAISYLQQNKNIALISDAGTPLISDPGYTLVTTAKKNQIKVVPIPGASSIISALSVCGLPVNSFYFLGFVPTKKNQKIKYIENIKYANNTVVCFESPQRIMATIQMLSDCLGPETTICVAKELTKSFETIITDSISNVIDFFSRDNENKQLGEFTIVISASRKSYSYNFHKILKTLHAELPKSQAAKIVAKITGVDKKDCYKALMELES